MRTRALPRAATAALAAAALGLLALLALAAAAGLALGAPGEPDRSFDGDGRRVINVSGAGADVARNVLVQPDGRVVLAGDYDDPRVFLAIRLNPDGSPDTSFAGDSGTYVDPPGGADTAWAAALQPDGKLLLGGATTLGEQDLLVVARLNADGTPDAGFGAGGLFGVQLTGRGAIRALAVQPGGRIIAAGYATPPNSQTFPFVLALNGAGRLDGGFGADGTRPILLPRSATPSGLALRPDGGIVVGGLVYDSMGRAVWLARLGPDGSLGDGFGQGGVRLFTPPGGVEDTGRLAVQPDGRIVIAASAGGFDDMVVLRVGADGADDAGFGDGGRATIDVGASDEGARALAVQANGKIVVAGYTEDAGGADRAAVARLQPGGSLDTTFGGDGRALLELGTAGEQATSVALAPDGGLVIAGITPGDLFVARLEGDPAAAGGGPAPVGGASAGGAAARLVPRCGGRSATIVGTSRRDALRGTRRADVIVALGGNDLVRGLGGNDLICLGAGNDRGIGGAGADRILGQAGADRAEGGPGRDLLEGGLGADVLLGGAGIDRLLGLAGRDRAVGGAGGDVCRVELRTAC